MVIYLKDNVILLLRWVNFNEGGKPKYAKESPWVRFGLKENQPTYKDYRGGRYDLEKGLRARQYDHIYRGSKSFLSKRFGYPYRRPGDSFCIRETLGLSGRVGMYGKLSTLLKGDTKSALLIFGGMDTQGEIFNDSFLLLPSFRQ